ncbi:unnamed protein product [Rhizophagus irregularis]|nr:unnamed protein product [Rhizophagus irregularis]
MSARSVITVHKNCSIIENPWFIDLIKTLQPGYDPPSRQVLSGTLLESETSRVNIRIMNELSADNNFTIAMDGWTDPHGNSLWAFMLMTGSSWLNEAIKSKNIEGGGLKTYVEIRWMTFYECIHSVWRLKDALQHPSMRGAGIHNTQFERIQKTALNIWKNLGHKKTSGLELKAQLCNKRSLNHIGNSISNDDVQKMIDNLFEEGDILNENEDEEEEYEEPPNIQKESVNEMLNIEQVIDLGPWVYVY